MDSEFDNKQNISGLLRYRSAPSSLFDQFTDGVRKIESCGSENNTSNQLVSQNSLGSSKAMVNSNSQLPPQYPRQNCTTTTHVGSMDGGYRVMGSNLMRQNSSPAGLFSQLHAQNGYGTLKGGVGGYRMANGANGDSISPSSSRSKGHFSFPSGTPSSLGMLSRISEVDNESRIATVPDEEKCGDGNSEAEFYDPGFPFTSWSDSSQFQDTITGHRRELDNEGNKLFVNAQIEELGNRPPILSHHLSLPKTPAELAVMEKLLHFQDTIPCKIRAKRGCATHPRSIAERVRRTRISERMRKLQDLVPNMDKQTNTADMLDLAVDYIKDLQEQYKTLSDIRANCKCSAMQNPVSNRRV